MELHSRRFENLTLCTAGGGLSVDASEYPASHFVSRQLSPTSRSPTGSRFDASTRKKEPFSPSTVGADDVSITDCTSMTEHLPRSLNQYGGDTISRNDFTPIRRKNDTVRKIDSRGSMRKVSVSISGARPIDQPTVKQPKMLKAQDMRGSVTEPKALSNEVPLRRKPDKRLPAMSDPVQLAVPAIIYSRHKAKHEMKDSHSSPPKVKTVDVLTSVGAELDNQSPDLMASQKVYDPISGTLSGKYPVNKTKGHTDSFQGDVAIPSPHLSHPSFQLAPLSGSSSLGEGFYTEALAPQSTASVNSTITGSQRPISPPLRVYDFAQMALMEYDMPKACDVPEDEPLYSREEIAQLTSSVLINTPASAPLPPTQSLEPLDSNLAVVTDASSDVRTAGVDTAAPRTISREASLNVEEGTHDSSAKVQDISYNGSAVFDDAAELLASKQPPKNEANAIRREVLHGHIQQFRASPTSLIQAYSVPYKLRGNRLSPDPHVNDVYHVDEYGRSGRLPDYLEEERVRLNRKAEQASVRAMKSVLNKHSRVEGAVSEHQSASVVASKMEGVPATEDGEVEVIARDASSTSAKEEIQTTVSFDDEALELVNGNDHEDEAGEDERKTLMEHLICAAENFDLVSESSDERQFDAIRSRAGSADYSIRSIVGGSVDDGTAVSSRGGSRGTGMSVRISGADGIVHKDATKGTMISVQDGGGSVTTDGSRAKRSSQGSRTGNSNSSGRNSRQSSRGFILGGSSEIASNCSSSNENPHSKKKKNMNKSPPVRVAYVLSRTSNASEQSLNMDRILSEESLTEPREDQIQTDKCTEQKENDLHDLSVSEDNFAEHMHELSLAAQLQEEFSPLGQPSNAVHFSPIASVDYENTRGQHNRYILTPSAAKAVEQGNLDRNDSVWSLSDGNPQLMTADGQPLMPFQVHRRLLGWKLTSQRRRRDLIGLLDMVTAGPSDESRAFSPPHMNSDRNDDFDDEDSRVSPVTTFAQAKQKYGPLPSSLKKPPLTTHRASADGTRRPNPRDMPPMHILHAHVMAANEQQRLNESMPTLPAIQQNGYAGSQYFRAYDGMLYDSQKMALDAYSKHQKKQKRLIERQSRSWQNTVQRQLQLRQGYHNQHAIKFLMQERRKKEKESEALLNHRRELAKIERQRREMERQQPPPNAWNDDISAGSLARIKAENHLLDDSSFASNTIASNPLEGVTANAKIASALDEATEEFVSKFFVFHDEAQGPSRGASRRTSRGGSRARPGTRGLSRESLRRKAGATPNAPTEDDIYNYPININRPKDRMDILQAVKARDLIESGPKSRDYISLNTKSREKYHPLHDHQPQHSQHQLPQIEVSRFEDPVNRIKPSTGRQPSRSGTGHAELMSEIHSLQAADLLHDGHASVAHGVDYLPLEGSMVSSLEEGSHISDFPVSENGECNEKQRRDTVIPINKWDED